MGLYRKVVKRLIDTTVAIIFGIVLIVPLFIVAILIKLTSKGPIFFKQERYGKNSVPFTLYKFRSMTDGAPVKANSEFSDIKSYVTPFGMFIRKTSIDELPQLINIIKGEMSFIGPRPLAITDEKVLRLRRQNGGDQVLPGISGLAQVNGRNNITDEDKAAYDAKYASLQSLRLDSILVVETIISVLKRENIWTSATDTTKKWNKDKIENE
ncbi:sugar transferase [Leuconostoc citreum]|uniref:sugar transferase n=1 Tax=Leuconostoc citreum TaxID=33964 RepID=UPI0021A2C912|nr:sugar transferase [Leuconostoc citreum]MCT3057824.1 sugar transferase [Leuconostoc citreum]MCT3073643.1 sugar transferase [Leuconostoc citreum]MDM7641801.1 sugar transferase [Leuconostoc citreum]